MFAKKTQASFATLPGQAAMSTGVRIQTFKREERFALDASPKQSSCIRLPIFFCPALR